MSDRGGHIGVFDSGIGGLSVLKALRAELPHQDFIYIADSGHAPYGERGDAHVLARSHAIAHYLIAQGVKALVVACNTATAAAIESLRAEHPGLPIIGVEPALKPAVALSQTGHIGVMATRGTLASARFRSLLDTQAGLTQVALQACDGLADAIEGSAQTGDFSKTIALCAQYTAAMGLFGSENGQIDTLVLGCTHYPFASSHLRALLGPEVRIVDSGEAVARQTRRLVGSEDAPGASATHAQLRLITTGQPAALQAAAGQWLGLSSSVEKLSIQ
ncbi:glutamate racemase [Polaromonas sp. OV174]|uniref:glutamate racemase n=1 Tax=Polaromonas sp. OV174 TaxID=1855300 RepID=UPI0008F0762E|nr:glutamate racemase [Polaromonas sp. OV174]SFC42848.1 glutamate racemase [Polaromonas sp. OV174]